MQSRALTTQQATQHAAALPMRPVGPTTFCRGTHARRCRPAVMVQAAAAEAEPSSDQPVKARVSKRRPKPLREDDWTQLKKAIHEDGTVLQPSSSSDSQAVHQLIEKLIADAEMRKKLPKVLDDKAARRYPPVRLLATTPADQLHCMGALAAASKQVALTLNPRPAAAAADGGSTAEEEPSSSSSSSSSSSDKPRPTRHSTARVAWQPVPVNNPLSGVVDVPVGSILYYATPALIAPPLWYEVTRKQHIPFEVRPNRNPARQAQSVTNLQQQILEYLDSSGQEFALVRCRGVEGLVLLNRVVAWLRRSLKDADWWEGGDIAAVLLYSFEEQIKPRTGGSSSSRNGSSGGGKPGTDTAEGQQQQQQQQTSTMYVVALMRCTPKQPWALDVLVPDTREQQPQQQAAEQQQRE